MSDTPNRYGAQGTYNETGVHCCCHMIPLTDICDGCEALRSTKRQPTLVSVDAVRMNPLNDDGVGSADRDPDDVAACCDVCGQESSIPDAEGERCLLCSGIYRKCGDSIGTLEELGDAMDDPEPEAGGSIRG